jgi:hypothetical protein
VELQEPDTVFECDTDGECDPEAEAEAMKETDNVREDDSVWEGLPLAVVVNVEPERLPVEELDAEIDVVAEKEKEGDTDLDVKLMEWEAESVTEFDAVSDCEGSDEPLYEAEFDELRVRDNEKDKDEYE